MKGAKRSVNLTIEIITFIHFTAFWNSKTRVKTTVKQIIGIFDHFNNAAVLLLHGLPNGAPEIVDLKNRSVTGSRLPFTATVLNLYFFDKIILHFYSSLLNENGSKFVSGLQRSIISQVPDSKLLVIAGTLKLFLSQITYKANLAVNRYIQCLLNGK